MGAKVPSYEASKWVFSVFLDFWFFIEPFIVYSRILYKTTIDIGGRHELFNENTSRDNKEDVDWQPTILSRKRKNIAHILDKNRIHT